jgi:hypothetical protein
MLTVKPRFIMRCNSDASAVEILLRGGANPYVQSCEKKTAFQLIPSTSRGTNIRRMLLNTLPRRSFSTATSRNFWFRPSAVVPIHTENINNGGQIHTENINNSGQSDDAKDETPVIGVFKHIDPRSLDKISLYGYDLLGRHASISAEFTFTSQEGAEVTLSFKAKSLDDLTQQIRKEFTK